LLDRLMRGAKVPQKPVRNRACEGDHAQEQRYSCRRAQGRCAGSSFHQ
jgi:hypothetical protein